MDAPRWLDDQKDICQLLHRFVDKLDAKPAAQWKQPPGITLTETTLPALSQGGDAADLAWALIKQLASDYDVFTLRPKPKRSPFDPDYLNVRLRLNLNSEAQLRAWLHRPQQVSYNHHWQTAVNAAASQFPGNTERLTARPIEVSGKRADEVVQAFGNIGNHNHLTLRQLSARCFWGDSKFLDHRGPLVETLFPTLTIIPRAVIINVHLPSIIRGVLFIENQDTYNLLITQPHTAHLALVYSSGFRAAAERIRTAGGATLHLHGDLARATQFQQWWQAEIENTWPVYFWGDLDFSGMAILAALKQRFTQLDAWQPGYTPMLDRLSNGGGHLPKMSDKQQQLDPGVTGCQYADTTLLPTLRQHGYFVDQEAVEPAHKNEET